MVRERVDVDYKVNDDKAGKKIKSLTKSVVALGLAFTAVLGAALVKTRKLFIFQRNVLRQTEAVLKSTKHAAGLTAKEINNLAGEMQKVTNFGDETVQTGQNLLLTFTKIGRDIFPQVTETMLDMSAAMGQDVKSSAIQLGKALNDPILGITALSRVGITFTEQQKITIRTLAEENKILAAQKIILSELETQFGGSARAQVDAVTQLKNAMGDLGESIGEKLAPAIDFAAGKLQKFVEAMILGFKDQDPAEKIAAMNAEIKSLQLNLEQFEKEGTDIGGIIGVIARVIGGDFEADKQKTRERIIELQEMIRELREEETAEQDAIDAAKAEKETESGQQKLDRFRDIEKQMTIAKTSEEFKRLKDKKAILAQEIKAEIEFDTQRRKNFTETMSFLASGMMTHNKAAFEIGKAVALGNAIMNAYQAFNVALASAPPPFNYALAAGVLTTGLAKAQQISSRRLELADGGIIPATPGGTAATIGEGGRDEAVIPLDDIESPFGGGGDQTVIIELEDGSELARGIFKRTEELKRTGEIDA